MKKLSTVLPELSKIAKAHGLRINRAKEFKLIVKLYYQKMG